MTPDTELTGWSRYSLVVGVVLSVLGVILGIIGGFALLLQGEVFRTLLLWFVGAPYSLAMAVVFRHVLRNG